MLRGKKILLGVTGGIAAYKTTYLVRLLIKAGAEVRVVLSPSARDFVTPLSLSTLSKNPVYWEYYDTKSESGEWHNHVELALWADLMILAPLTANTLAKMASGQSDNFLMAVYLSAKCPVFFAPAMDLDMYKHPATLKNIKTLESFGHIFIPAESGELASGLNGEGRMAEPETIHSKMASYLVEQAPLRGKNILITAGPTYEIIDPVRFIGNRSSGKMGMALAEAAAEKGANVTLVLGPSALETSYNAIKVIRVESTAEMLIAAQDNFQQADWAIFSAAVADYRPKIASNQKIKKQIGQEEMQLELIQNPDILKTLSAQKTAEQLIIGFALETENALENARKKLHTKNCDWIVLNSPDSKERGFGHDTNEVRLIGKDQEQIALSLKLKKELAHEILDILHKRHN
jgi:phosphopantothenoylcysteine decarboxylase/phosphopantothenate--cysteine ligase